MSFKQVDDLLVYRISLKLAQEVSELTKTIPFNWKVEEVAQILSSSSSVPSNIAEGFAQRFYPKQYIRYLLIALGSSDETQHHLILIGKKRLINSEKIEYYIKNYKNLSVRILNLINYLKKKHNIIL